jgi:catechol 2,3-dioxygenase-like lactoylglutathione lyase family enzyme
VVRSTTHSFQARNLSASLTVRDIQASLAWYRDVVGFTVEQRHEREGALRAVSLSAGAVRVLIGQDDGAKGSDRLKGQGFSLQSTMPS